MTNDLLSSKACKKLVLASARVLVIVANFFASRSDLSPASSLCEMGQAALCSFSQNEKQLQQCNLHSESGSTPMVRHSMKMEIKPRNNKIVSAML